MNDLTLIYYTANLVEETFANKIKEALVKFDIPIICVSQKPMYPHYAEGGLNSSGCSSSRTGDGTWNQYGPFGLNICVGEIGASIYNIYRQVLIGTKAAETEYVACCEDDALYNAEHFSKRPRGDVFIYNLNRWNVNEDVFFHRKKSNMSMCIAPRKLMIDTLEKRFAKYPNPLIREKGELIGFGEPGRSEEKLGLPPVKMETFYTKIPTLVFNHRPSVGGVRRIMRRDTIKRELPYWGKATDLWNRMWNGSN